MLKFVVALCVLAAGAPAAFASQPPPDDTGGGGADDNRNHVWEPKPWKARFEYKIIRDAKAYAELNSRSDVVGTVAKGQWHRIDCQLTTTTQNGRVTFDHLPSVGWVADQHVRTYVDGPLEGAPTCPDPTGNHVWFAQGWAAHKEYRVRRTIAALTRPGGAETGEGYVGLTWTTIQCADTSRKRPWVRTAVHPTAGELWIPARALRFFQKGVPAGLPSCVSATPLRFAVLGDSYAAGIGAGSIMDFTNPYETGDEGCERSSKSYWSLLGPGLRPGLTTSTTDFEACTGDKTSDLRRKYAGALSRDTALVTVSIGGNDLHFSTILKKCVTPGGTSCPVAVATYINNGSLARLQADLDETYRLIRERAPNALVLVIGYPQLVPPDHIDDCGAMDDSDAPNLTEAGRRVNDAIRAIVQRHERFRFVGLVGAFKGHTACNKGSEDWINGFNGGSFGMASFHPNEKGNAAIAGRILQAAPRFFK